MTCAARLFPLGRRYCIHGCVRVFFAVEKQVRGIKTQIDFLSTSKSWEFTMSLRKLTSKCWPGSFSLHAQADSLVLALSVLLAARVLWLWQGVTQFCFHYAICLLALVKSSCLSLWSCVVPTWGIYNKVFASGCLIYSTLQISFNHVA